MTAILLVIALALTLVLPTPGPRNHPPVAENDQYHLLYDPLPIVEIPVLENDMDPDGDVLWVTALSGTEGGKAEIVNGTTVRVAIDWSQQDPGGSFRLVAHGTYVVSDGLAQSEANWGIWYWPEIPPLGVTTSTEGGN